MQVDLKKIEKLLELPSKGTQRKPHFLKKGKHIPATPKRVVFFDSESRVDKETHEHEPYIICAVFKNYEKGSVRRFRYGSDLALQNDPTLKPLNDFWDEITRFTKIKDLTWVMAHNCGYDILATGGAKRLFDRGFVPLGHPYEKGMTFIWEVAQPNPEPRHCGEWFIHKTKTGYKIKNKCTEETPCGKCKKKRRHIRNIRFVSTSNYFTQSLKKLGDTFGVSKLNQEEETKFDFDRIHEYPIETVLTYCDRDVDIIVNAMEALFEACKNGAKTGFGSFRNTLPAMAFNAYKTWFMPNQKLHAHNNNDAIRLERSGYYGGRVEVWKRGEAREQIYGVDINSMYPFVMRNHSYPTKLISHTKRETVDGLQSLIKNGYAVIAKVTISTMKNAYPMRYENKLVFPTGTFVTTISTPEIEYALEHGHITKVHEACVYEKEPIFREFVDRFYTAREKHKPKGSDPNPVWDLLYKLVMNALYGKFGQLKREWQEVGTCDPDLVETEEVFDVSGDTPVKLRFRKFGGKVYVEEPVEDVAYHAVIAIATHVTAYARMLMWKYIQIAGEENHYYNDTDSLYVNETGYQNLKQSGMIHDTKLGYLALEKQPESAVFLGPKHYQLGKERKLKGVSSDAKQIDQNTFEMLQWPSFKSAMNTGNLDRFANRKVVKHLKNIYSKGWVLANGEVKPLQFETTDEGNALLPWEKTEYRTLDDLEPEANADKPRNSQIL